MHALIIEMEPIVALMIQDVLEESGFDTFAVATTAEEAMNAANERCPDLIVAETELKGCCGIELVQSLCSGKPIPVIFASQTFQDALARVPTAKAIRKPFWRMDLAAAVGEARAGRASH
jgi:DNA-binding response OmpR family regulator